jgi:hypothetical protein
LNAPNI